MASSHSNNALWRKGQAEFTKELLRAAKGVGQEAMRIIVNATDSFLDFVQDNKELLPYDTGNLHDSIATAVIKNGRIARANYMPREAVRAQRAPGRKRIWGYQEAFRIVRALGPKRDSSSGRITYPAGPNGVVAKLFVAVPYAQGVNTYSPRPASKRRIRKAEDLSQKIDRTGYLQRLEMLFENDIATAIQSLAMYPTAKSVYRLSRR